MIEKRFENRLNKSNMKFNTLNPVWDNEKEDALNVFEMIEELNYLNDCYNNLIDDNTEYVAEINQIHKKNEQLKEELKRCRNWINSDKNDYELTLAFIKNKGYSLKDVLEYEKELKKND